MTQRPVEPDPEKTVTDPAVPFDPDATVSSPAPVPGLGAAPDPGAAAAKPATEPDPEATVRGPLLRPGPEPDPDSTVRQPVPDFDLDFDPTGSRPAGEAAPATPRPSRDADATLSLPLSALMEEAQAEIAVPAPGRRRNPFAPKQGRSPVQADLAALGGLNRLIAVANPILGGVPHIRHTLDDPNPARFLDTMRGQIEAFEANADAAGIPAESVAVAKYALCALIDESAASTPWGGDWLKAGLLHSVHGEGWGGEKFFMLLSKMAENPVGNRDLLEFFYVCLALGYEGRYRVIDDGRRQLDEVYAKIYEILRRQRTRTDRVLSPSWRAVSTPVRPPERSARVLWGITAAAALVLAINQLLDPSQPTPLPVERPLQAVQSKPPVPSASIPVSPQTEVKPAAQIPAQAGVASPPQVLVQAKPPAPSAPVPAPSAADAKPAAQTAAQAIAPPSPSPAPAPASLASQFGEEIRRGLITVTEDAGRKRIEIRSDLIFPIGGARVAPAAQPIVLRIAEALERVPGTITVTGHTDSIPIASARFPSNLELSVARAQSAVSLISTKLSDPRRLKVEGRADAEPVAPNDTEANRAKNRRVVIIVETRP